jgi:hypothetical protein
MGDRITQMMNVQSNALDLFAKKNADYGDAFAQYGIIGVLIRIQDKIKRALTITSNNINLVDDENIADTMLDLHNYAAMALILMEEGKADKYLEDDSDVDNGTQTINFIELDDGYEDGDISYELCDKFHSNLYLQPFPVNDSKYEEEYHEYREYENAIQEC